MKPLYGVRVDERSQFMLAYPLEMEYTLFLSVYFVQEWCVLRGTLGCSEPIRLSGG